MCLTAVAQKCLKLEACLQDDILPLHVAGYRPFGCRWTRLGCTIQCLCDGMQTLLCANVLPDQMIQVTPEAVQLLPASGDRLLNDWHPPAGLHINLASASPSQACGRLHQCLNVPFVQTQLQLDACMYVYMCIHVAVPSRVCMRACFKVVFLDHLDFVPGSTFSTLYWTDQRMFGCCQPLCCA